LRITNLKIHNFRSVLDVELEAEPLVVLIGPNNHGKSNILAALDFALSTATKPTSEDFCAFGCDDELWVELTFDELTPQEKTTFKKYVSHVGTFRLRKTARLDNNGQVEISYRGYVWEPDKWWLKSDSVDRLTSREAIKETDLKDRVPASGRISKKAVEEAQQEYIEEHRDSLVLKESLEYGPFMGLKTVGGGLLPDFYLVPAVHDLSDEIKFKQSTVFGRLLGRAVQEMAEREPQFQALREGLAQLIAAFNPSEEDGSTRPPQLVELEDNLAKELKHWGVDISIEITPPDIEKIFELGTNVQVDDGIRTSADRKGHGLQRALMFAFLRAWAKTLRSIPDPKEPVAPRKTSESVIFAIEEPELFLHPHAQRNLAESIEEIAETPEHQVFICTHSTHFVDLDKYRSLVIVNRQSLHDGTDVHQCNEELFAGESLAQRKMRFRMARWINPDRGEMFFAKRVVFVEGETEKVSLPYLAHKLGCFDQDISIIDCGSKHNLPLYISIANAFDFKYVVVHDEDPLPDPIPADWSEEKLTMKKRTFEMNNEIDSTVNHELGIILMLRPDFEGVTGVSSTQGTRKGKPLAALDYFEGQTEDGVAEEIKSVVRTIYSVQGI
jgi:putative ATP-dependent endonuclease of OLD family